MRLWHYKLIPYLPRRQLLSQHRECCALRGLGWGKKHSTVDHVFKGEFNEAYCKLYVYHYKVMEEMIARGYKVDEMWFNYYYRGKRIGIVNYMIYPFENKNYEEHDDNYLKECLENLKNKGVILNYESNN